MNEFRDRFLSAFGSRPTGPDPTEPNRTGAAACLQVRARPGPDRRDSMTVRWITAAAVLVSAYVHLKEWLDGAATST